MNRGGLWVKPERPGVDGVVVTDDALATPVHATPASTATPTGLPRRSIRALGRRSGRRSGRATAGLVAVAAAGSLGIAAGPLGASSASAVEVTPRPASGSVVIEGRGFGHGRGMSQWGAYGAADAGLAWADILDFYYPGTARTSIGDGSIRVLISADTDGDTTVLPAAGLSVTFGRTVVALPAGAGYTAWRAVRYPNGVTLQHRDAAGAWKPWRSFRMSGGSLVFRTTDGIVRIALPGGGQQDVRGAVFATMTGSTMQTVLNSSMESYLRSVVPSEMPSSWHVEALSAQSVAARTYAAAYRDRQRAKGASWDICDTISCQVFKGVARYTKSGSKSVEEDARADAAIAATRGVVMRTSKAANAPFAFAEFSASNGGYSVAGGPAYQVAKSDPYDGRMKNPNTGWTKPVTVTALEQKFGLGQLIDIRIVERDGRGELGGRVQELQLTGTTRAVTVSGAKLRQVLSLRSDWFVVKAVPVPPTEPAGRTPAGKR